jgi:hypothetical protein
VKEKTSACCARNDSVWAGCAVKDGRAQTEVCATGQERGFLEFGARGGWMARRRGAFDGAVGLADPRQPGLREQSALVQLAGVWAATFPSGWQRSAACFGDGWRLAQSVGCMGGDIQQDKVGHSQYVVSSRQGARIVFRSALPFYGAK